MTKLKKRKLTYVLTDVRYLRDRCRNSTSSRSIKPPKTLAKVLKQAKKEGMDVTLAPDGSMTFKNVSGNNMITLQDDGAEQNTDQGSELDQWLAKRHAH